MKLTRKIKDQFAGLGESAARYPITALLSFALMIILITLSERNIRGFYENETLTRISMTFALGLPLSVSLKHLVERFTKRGSGLLLLVPVTTLLLGAYYFFFTKDMNATDYMRYAGTLFFLLVTVFFTLKIRRNDKYEVYVMRIFSGFFLTVLYAGVLYLGVAAIIFTINSLFDAEIDSKYYLYVFFFTAFVFGMLMLLSKLPKEEETFEGSVYSKGLKVLVLYIVIPLITIYTGILYVYFAKILFTQVWPRGLVSNLVLWYSVLSAAVIFFITPILEENKVAMLFRTWFPRISFPILAMMFVSIGIRIRQYGFTEPRYFVVLLGIWVALIMGYYVARRQLKNTFVPMSLAVFVLLSMYGPLSAFNVSANSQNARLTALLEKNSMLVSGEVVPGKEVSTDDKRDISSIVLYFSERGFEKLSYLPEDFQFQDFNKVFGFDPFADNYFPGQRYLYLHAEPNNKGIDIAGYDLYFPLATYQAAASEKPGIEASLSSADQIIRLKDQDQIIFEVSIAKELQAFLDTYGENDGKKVLSYDDLSFLVEDKGIKAKVIVRDLSATIQTDTPRYESIDLILLVDLP